MNKVIKNSELKHYGVIGQKWGVRKDYSRVTTLHRVTKTKDETSIPDGYYTTSEKEAKSFNNFIRDNNIPGVKLYNMHVALKDIIVTPSKKEEVDIQLELLKDKKIKDLWSNAIADKKMSSMTMGQRHELLSEYREYEDYWRSTEAKKDLGDRYEDAYASYKTKYAELKKDYNLDRKNIKTEVVNSIKKGTNEDSLLYFSMAVFGSPELRKVYREVLTDKGYNAVEDYWGQKEKNISGMDKLSSPSAIMILDKSIFRAVKVK